MHWLVHFIVMACTAKDLQWSVKFSLRQEVVCETKRLSTTVTLTYRRQHGGHNLKGTNNHLNNFQTSVHPMKYLVIVVLELSFSTKTIIRSCLSNIQHHKEPYTPSVFPPNINYCINRNLHPPFFNMTSSTCYTPCLR